MRIEAWHLELTGILLGLLLAVAGYVKQGRQIRELEDAVRALYSRQDRLQSKLPKSGKDWNDDDRLTSYNWRRPEPF